MVNQNWLSLMWSRELVPYEYYKIKCVNCGKEVGGYHSWDYGIGLYCLEGNGVFGDDDIGEEIKRIRLNASNTK